MDELTILSLTFPSRAMAVVTASTHLARHHVYRVRGSQGVVTVPNAFVPRDDEATRAIIEYANGKRHVERFPPWAAFRTEIKHLAEAARTNNRRLLPPMEDAVANAAVLEAAIQSMGQGWQADLMGSKG